MNTSLVEIYGNKLSQTNVEVKIDSTQGRYFLPDDSILRNAQILEVWTIPNPNDNIDSPTGRDLVTDAILRGCALTLICENKRFWERYPLSDLISENNNGLHRQLVAPDFTPSKSYIDISGPTPVAGESVMLYFTYIHARDVPLIQGFDN